jgi:hypothetical protein
MGRKLLFVLALAMSILVVQDAFAITIIEPKDFEHSDFEDKEEFGETIDDDFFGDDEDTLINKVYLLENGNYLYKHKVTPDPDEMVGGLASLLHTGFSVKGFTGEAGWDFDDASEDAFLLTLELGQLHWKPLFDWSDESIKFFFVSTLPPTIKTYVLQDLATPTHNSFTAESYAPTPEPGSMMLLGSGLAALYARRRRIQKR